MLRVFVMPFVRAFSWAQMNNSAHMHTVSKRSCTSCVGYRSRIGADSQLMSEGTIRRQEEGVVWKENARPDIESIVWP